MEALELGHRQWLAGVEYGERKGQRMAVDSLAAELLHRQACDMLGLATTAARERHGEAWASAIARQGSDVRR